MGRMRQLLRWWKHAGSMAEKDCNHQKVFTGGPWIDFLAAADKADKAEKKMLTTKQEFAAESLKAAEDAVIFLLESQQYAGYGIRPDPCNCKPDKRRNPKAGNQGGNG